MEKRPSSSRASTSSSSFSSCSSSCSMSTLSSPCLLSPVPTTIYVQLPDDRNYSALLRQTELVYDQLLADRQRKLQQKINDRQMQYQDNYTHLVQTDRNKAAEFERWASGALWHLKNECLKELDDLRQDYEAKFVKLKISLEEQSMAEHRKPSRTVRFQSPPQQPPAAVPHKQPMYLSANRH